LALALGLALTVTQVLIACALSGRSRLPDAYLSLFQFDSWWQADIAARGYVPLEPATVARLGGVEGADGLQANVAFMPGYPLFGRLVARLTGLPVRVALLAAAHLACWACWTYLLLICGHGGLSPRRTALAVLLVFAHPGAFFLVAAYAEGLFLAGLLGFLYWQDRPGRAAVVLAALHGFIMGATRLFGLPLAAYPLLRAALRRSEGAGWRRWTAPLLVSGAAGLGGLLFFGYCQLRFGRWDQHMESLRLGWTVKPCYLALLSPQLWDVNFPRTDHGFLAPDSLSRLLAPGTLLLLVGLLALEAWLARGGRPTGWRHRWGLYCCAALMYYINVSGRLCVHMIGMVRYDLAVYALLALGLAHLLAHAGPPQGWLRRLALVLLVLWCLTGLALQLGFIYRFTHALWVA
jgi:hypothetical protein